MSSELRRARRVVLNAPAIIEPVGQGGVDLHPTLAAVYSRVEASREAVGQRFPGVVRDLSTNGAFIAGPALPLLSRVAVRFEFEGHGRSTRSAGCCGAASATARSRAPQASSCRCPAASASCSRPSRSTRATRSRGSCIARSAAGDDC